MTRSKMFWELMIYLFVAFSLISACSDETYMEIEKEQVKYKNKIEKTADNIDRKLAELRTEAKEADEKPEEDIQLYIVQLETLEERLNKKSGEIEAVPDNEWDTLKSEIDELISDYEEITKRIDS